MTQPGVEGSAEARGAALASDDGDLGGDAALGDDSSDGGSKPPQSRLRQVLTIALSLGLGVAVLLFVIPQFADLDKVWEQVQAMTGLEIAVLAIAAIWNLITYWIVIV